MKLPYIHRDSYDWAIKQLGQRDTRVRELELQNIELTKQIVALKHEGFVAQPDYSAYIEAPLSVDEADALRVEQEQDDG